MSTIQLTEVKDELRKSGAVTVDDGKIQRFIDAAEAEYTDWVGPITGDVTEVFDGGGTTYVFRALNVTALTAATYDSGAPLALTDLELDPTTGIIRWKYRTAGRFIPGTRVTVTGTVGALPANHREVIVADIAGYFAMTQRGAAAPPTFPGAGADAAAYSGTPRVLFPRIRELAKSYPAVP